MTDLQALARLQKSELLDLLNTVYGLNDLVDRYIDQAAAKADDSLKKQLLSQITSIKRGRKFIDYSESIKFSSKLSILLDGLKILLEQHPLEAFEVADKFMASADSIFARADDSSGTISDIYFAGVQLWILAAIEMRKSGRSQIDWVDRVLYYFNNNDYGIYDGLLPSSAGLLTKTELQQLARRFENETKTALEKTPSSTYNEAAAHAGIGLGSVAKALEDPTLYERSILISSPQPNELQKESLAKFCLTCQQPERALTWLQGDWSLRFAGSRTRLLEACYQQLGQDDKIRELHRGQFRQYPSWETLKPLLAVVDQEEKQDILAKARAQAQALATLQDALTLLLNLEDTTAAADVVEQRHQELCRISYERLLKWAKQFNNEHPFAAMLCYRALLNDILDQGRSTAYQHAARYFKALLALDERINNYRDHPDAQQHIRLLQDKHWRKHSFWGRADHPNKPPA